MVTMIDYIEPVIGDFPIVYKYIVNNDGVISTKKVFYYGIFIPSSKKVYEEVFSHQIVYKKFNDISLNGLKLPQEPWDKIPFEKYFLFITYGSSTTKTQEVSFFNGNEFVEIKDWKTIDKLHKIIVEFY